MAEINNDKLVIDGGKRLSLTNVEAVNGFSDTFLNLTVSGKVLKILGNNIKITSFNKGTGNLSCDGEFLEIKFGAKKKPVFKKVFK